MRGKIVVILSALALVVNLVPAVPVIADASYEGFTDTRSAANVTSIEVAKPAATASGDLLIGVVITDGDTSGEFTGSTNWTLIDIGWSGAGTFDGCTLGAWYRIAGDIEPDSYQWTWTTPETVYAFIIRITWHDTDNPIDVWGFDTGVDDMLPTCPDVTTTVADTLVLRLFGYDSCYAWNATYPDEHNGGTVESSRSGCEPGAEGHCSGGAAYTTQATAGATGTASFQVTQGESFWAWRTLTIAVRPTPVQYDLTISSTGGGSVTTPGEDTFTYDEGEVVYLVVTPDAGYRFDEWTGNVNTIADVNAAVTIITMNGDYAITAEFVRQYDLTISSTGGGSVTTPGEDTFTYDEGKMVYLVATPDAGYRFDEWTGDVSTIADVNAAVTIITMNGGYAITAEFVRQYDLTTNSTTGGSVTKPGEGVFTYDEGTVVNLVATPDAGYWLGEWAGNVSTIADVNAAVTTITMNDDYAITANFEEISPTPVYPTVTTQAATGVSTRRATLNMDYTVGDFNPVQVRFAYKEFAGSSWSYTAWVSKTADGTHAEVLTGLDSDTTYGFKAQLKGSVTVESTTLQFTTDKSSTPPPTPPSTSPTPPPSGGEGCFIATAAYGTSTAEQINVLREFRDVVLLESTVGSQFVALYYQLSPPVADFISGSGFFRTLVRELLVDPIVWVVEATGDIWQN